MAKKIQVKRGLKADLPVLDVGEPALTTDEKSFYIGTSSGNVKLATDEQINLLSAYATASGTNAYVASVAGIMALKEGMSVKIKFTNANIGASTLNINSLGAKSIIKGNGSALSGGDINAGQIFSLIYNGSNFQLLSERGAKGDKGDTGSAGKDGLTTSVNGIQHVSGNVSLKAENIPIVDSGNKFDSNNVEGALTEVFQSVSDGKSLVAGAITGKGIGTSPTATFQIMADNIRAIETDPSIGTTNATPNDIRKGKHAVVNGSIVNGELRKPTQIPLLDSTPYAAGIIAAKAQPFPPDQDGAQGSDAIITSSAGTSPTQFLISSDIVGVTADKIAKNQSIMGISGTYTADATAVAGDMLTGKTAYVNGNKITGTIPTAPTWPVENNASDVHFYGTNMSSSHDNNNIYMNIPRGYYSGTWAGASLPTLIPENIKAGVVIGGNYTKPLTGTFTSDATAASLHIYQGKTAYVNGNKITGSMIDRSAESAHQTSLEVQNGIYTSGNPNIRTYFRPPEGYYNGVSWVAADNPNLTPANIKSGVNILGVVGTYGSDIEMNTWFSGNANPSSISRYTSQVYNGKIYYPDNDGATMHIYNIASNTWTTGATAPSNISRKISHLYNGRIYCRGGTAIQIYNIASNTWTTGATAPSSISLNTGQLYNGKIYYPGSEILQIYDIASNSWTTGASAPSGITRETSQLYDGKIYCPAGGSSLKAIQLYNIASNSWTVGVEAPASIMCTTSQLYNGKIYCPQSSGTGMQIYDIASNSWTTGASAPSSFARRTSQLYNGKIYCPQSGGTAIQIYDIASNTWTTGATAPSSISLYISDLYNGRIYCAQSNGTTMNIYNALAFK